MEIKYTGTAIGGLKGKSLVTEELSLVYSWNHNGDNEVKVEVGSKSNESRLSAFNGTFRAVHSVLQCCVPDFHPHNYYVSQ